MKRNSIALIAWIIGTLFVVYAFALNTAAAVFSESIKTYLHATNEQTSLAVGAFIIGFAFMQIPGGYLLDRFNIRFVLSSAVLILAVGNFTISIAHSLPLLALSNFIQGVGASFAFIGAGKIILQWFAPRLFPILFGLTQSISCILAAMIHYQLVQELKETTFQMIYQGFSLFGLILALLALLFVRKPTESKAKKPLALKESLKTVFRNRQIWLCSFAAATSFGSLVAYASFWYINVQKFYSVESSDALIISGMIFVGIGIGTPFLGWLSNRLNTRKGVIHFTVTLGNMFLIAGLYLPHLDIDTFIPIKIISFLIGFFLSGSMLFYTRASELSTEDTKAVALGLVNTAVFLFNSLLLFIPYYFITATSKSYFTNLWILPFSVMISLILTYFVKDQQYQ